MALPEWQACFQSQGDRDRDPDSATNWHVILKTNMAILLPIVIVLGLL